MRVEGSRSSVAIGCTGWLALVTMLGSSGSIVASALPVPDPSAVTTLAATAQEHRVHLDDRRDALGVLLEDAQDSFGRWVAKGRKGDSPVATWAERIEAFADEHPESASIARAGALDLGIAAEDWTLADRSLRWLATHRPGEVATAKAIDRARGAMVQLASRDDAGRRWIEDTLPWIVSLLDAAPSPDVRMQAGYLVGQLRMLGGDDDAAKDAFRKVLAIEGVEHDAPSRRAAKGDLFELEHLGVCQEAPDFQAPELAGGGTVCLSELRGGWVLLDFWAVWCTPCRAAAPELRRIQERFAGDDFAVLGVTLDDERTRDRLLAFLEKLDLPWPQVYEGKGWGSDVGALYNVQYLPRTYLIDPAGRIAAKDLDPEGLERLLEERLGAPAEDA